MNYQDNFIDEGKNQTRGSFDFRARDLQFIELMQIPIISELAASRPFRRLKHIRFLGAIDYFIVCSPNGYSGNQRYTRYEHSLGVALLALQYAKIAEVDVSRLNTLLAAALLHDLGHPPLSHSVERLFKVRFGLDHHDLTGLMIRGKAYSAVIPKILLKFGVDSEEVLRLVSGQSDEFGRFFSGPINFDTIEGISRASVYVSSSLHVQKPENTVKAAVGRRTFSSERIVDEFWELKNNMYKVVINSPVGVMADFLSAWHVEKALNRLDHRIVMATEKTLFRLIPELRDGLRHQDFRPIYDAGYDKLSFNRRNFFVDRSVSFVSRMDALRYRQSKETQEISLKKFQRELHDTLAPNWLFND